MKRYAQIESPIGPLLLTGDGDGITGLYMNKQLNAPDLRQGWRREQAVFKEALAQLRAYFAKELTTFDLPLNAKGTSFQQTVWRALRTIPFGSTVTYKSIAEAIRSPRAVRAVGLANGKNPIGIIVPCHRVIGSNGKLTGYAGGLERKRWLLNHEKQGSPLKACPASAASVLGTAYRERQKPSPCQ